MITIPDIAIFLGSIIIITRLPGVIWPEQCKSFLLKLIQSPYFIRFTGVLAFVLSTVILYSVLKNMNFLEIILVIVGVLWFAAGVIINYKPSSYTKLSKLILGESLLRFRILMGVGAIMGISFFGLGIYYKFF